VTDPLSRDLKRIELARRLLSHQVRTQTITRLTGMTRNRLATLRRRLMIGDTDRRRGPPPSSFNVFLRTSHARSEGAAIVSLCRSFDAVPELYCIPAKKHGVDLHAAERLCDAYEAYRACRPATDVELEEVVLLLAGLAQGDIIELVRCKGCKCANLVSRVDGTRSMGHRRLVLSNRCKPPYWLQLQEDASIAKGSR